LNSHLINVFFNQIHLKINLTPQNLIRIIKQNYWQKLNEQYVLHQRVRIAFDFRQPPLQTELQIQPLVLAIQKLADGQARLLIHKHNRKKRAAQSAAAEHRADNQPPEAVGQLATQNAVHLLYGVPELFGRQLGVQLGGKRLTKLVGDTKDGYVAGAANHDRIFRDLDRKREALIVSR